MLMVSGCLTGGEVVFGKLLARDSYEKALLPDSSIPHQNTMNAYEVL